MIAELRGPQNNSSLFSLPLPKRADSLPPSFTLGRNNHTKIGELRSSHEALENRLAGLAKHVHEDLALNEEVRSGYHECNIYLLDYVHALSVKGWHDHLVLIVHFQLCLVLAFFDCAIHNLPRTHLRDVLSFVTSQLRRVSIQQQRGA